MIREIEKKIFENVRRRWKGIGEIQKEDGGYRQNSYFSKVLSIRF